MTNPHQFGGGFLFDEKFDTGVPVIILSGKKGVRHLLWCDENPDKFQITEGGSPVVTKCG